MLTEDIKVKKFTDYKSKLVSYIGEEVTEKLINLLGGDNKVINATFDCTQSSGCAYAGSFVENSLRLTSYAIKLNDLLPEAMKADKKSIVKVGLLGQVAKVLMFEENDSSWEVNNKGLIYKYVELEGALRVGERSSLLLLTSGVNLSPIEYEAIKIIDKDTDNDNYSKFFSSTLSSIIKMSNEMINIINKNKNNA